MSLRAIVFDFDGVIANSEPLHFRAYRDVLAEERIALTEHDYYKRYLGFDDVGAFRAIGEDHGVAFGDDQITELVARKAVILETIERDTSVLFPGAVEAVRRASAAMPIAIASGALRAEIERVLDAADLSRHFVGIVSAEDTRLSKPAPDPYLRAVALLAAAVGSPALAPKECAAIEDSRWGLESARIAGLRTIGITHTYAAAALGPVDLVIDSLDAFDPEHLRRLWS